MEYSRKFLPLIGKPYEELECWGVVKEFYKLVFDIELKRYYDEIPEDLNVRQNLIYSNRGDFVKSDTPQFGDILTISVRGIENHVAIYLDGQTILHTQIRTGCIVDRLAKWEKIITGYYRINK